MRYSGAMEIETRHTPRLLMMTVLAGCFVLLSLLALFGWIVQGPEMFLAMAESGLSWCL